MKQRTISLTVFVFTMFAFGLTANAQNLSQLAGTYSVEFQPVTSGGKLQGCSLIYNVVFLDYAYLKGAPVLAVGNITYAVSQNAPGLSLKLGLNEMLNQSHIPESPNYAYLKTKNGTTAGVKYVSADSDLPGYKMFVYQLNSTSIPILGDLLDRRNPTIGFNRSKGGIDATFEIDLTVEDTGEYKDGKLQRRYSNDAIHGFSKCFAELTSSLKQ